MPRLIVTADDVGLHPGMTAGAIRAHRDGIVTACSIVANGAAFDDAVERLRAEPHLEVGVHLALVEERPVASDVPSLIAEDGRMTKKWTRLLPRYALGLVRIGDVERELRAQIERVLNAGIRPSHLNGHQHLHLLPRVFDVVLRLAREYGIGYVRTVSEPATLARGPFRAASIAALSRLGRAARKRARSQAITTNDATVGVLDAGHLTADRLIALLDDIDGVTELVCHPGDGDTALAAAYDWRYDWTAETDALCDPRVARMIQERGIELGTPSGLPSS
ncbi:MAG TPA: ChbG/HpnK family deacetylase [Thermoanaerobaculia bacterium]|nr:ChbG/HpnK family deacetylase [Thermoanaerobaculia bacterium]